MLVSAKKSKIIFLTGLIVFIILSVVIPFLVKADYPAGNGIQNPIGTNDFSVLVVRIINWVAGIVASLAVLMVVVGGFQMMISGGNDEKVKSARQTIQWALIGLIVVLASWALLKAILDILS